MIVFFLEVTQKLALRTLASRGSCGDITPKLGAQSIAAQSFKVPSFFGACSI